MYEIKHNVSGETLTIINGKTEEKEKARRRNYAEIWRLYDSLTDRFPERMAHYHVTELVGDYDSDYDGGYGVGSYFAHAMEKDD